MQSFRLKKSEIFFDTIRDMDFSGKIQVNEGPQHFNRLQPPVKIFFEN